MPRRPTTLATYWASLLIAACGDPGPAGDGDGGASDGGKLDQMQADAGDRPADGATGDSAPGDGAKPDAPPSGLGCPALPAPTGAVVMVTPAMADALPGMVSGAKAGTTFSLADGTYSIKGGTGLIVRATGVTIRSASSDASKVILDGEYKTSEVVVVSASDTTVAHVTVTHAVDHGVHAYPLDAGPDVKNLRLYGMRLVDNGEQFVKVNPNGARSHFVDGGRLECSYFELTDAGRARVETLGGTSCYTGGIDAHAARGWIVRQNTFKDIYCTSGLLAEHAIHFWTGGRDTLVENNTIVDCGRGIGFGLVEMGASRSYADDPYPGVGYVGHYDGIIRNNVISASVKWFDTGIELAQARGARVYHNTVHAAPSATGFFSSIDRRFMNTVADIRNNLVGKITTRSGATGMVANNKETTPASYFKDAANLDFHLAPGAADAIDKGVSVAEAGLDMDGQSHATGPGPDIGADEYQP